MSEFAVHAEHFAEMVRQAVYERYQDDAYTQGHLRVYTTLLSDAPGSGLPGGAPRRAGLRPPPRLSRPRRLRRSARQADRGGARGRAAGRRPTATTCYAAVVVEASPKLVKAYRKRRRDWSRSARRDCKFAARMLGRQGEPPTSASGAARSSGCRRTRRSAGRSRSCRRSRPRSCRWTRATARCARWSAASTSTATSTTTSRRRCASRARASSPSSIPPRSRRASRPATIINDAPLTFTAAQTGSEPWEPKNYDGKFDGPMRLRTALVKSKNLVSVRILQAISPQYAQDYITRFGFDPKLHPPYLTMALGAGNVTPLQMVRRLRRFRQRRLPRRRPYFIERIEDSRGNVLAQAKPASAGRRRASASSTRATPSS